MFTAVVFTITVLLFLWFCAVLGSWPFNISVTLAALLPGWSFRGDFTSFNHFTGFNQLGSWVESGDVAIHVKLGPPSSWKRPFQKAYKFNFWKLGGFCCSGKKGKALFKRLIEAAISLVVNSTGLNIFLFIQSRCVSHARCGKTVSVTGFKAWLTCSTLIGLIWPSSAVLASWRAIGNIPYVQVSLDLNLLGLSIRDKEYCVEANQFKRYGETFSSI
jgi:hypothetical protein